MLHDVGTMIAGPRTIGTKLSLDKKIQDAIKSLEDLGGAAIAEKSDGGVMIKSESCPFADAVVEHPEICKVAESMIGEIVG